MKRVVLFAHFDKQNIIDPYVVIYLEELKKYSEIIFISDGDLAKLETEKIKDLCFDIIAKKHGEYDFGSYKKGFQLLQNKYPQKFQEIDELLFVNDSCYLIGNLKQIFADMEKKQDFDFWGLTDDYNNFHKDRVYYIGTFFITFRRSVFLESFFLNFIQQITKLSGHKEIVTKYEVGLSKILFKNQKKSFAYFGVDKINQSIINNYIEFSDKIIELFIKNLKIKYKCMIPILSKIFNIYSLNYLHSDKFYFLLENNFPLLKRKIIEKKQFPKEILLHLWQEILAIFYPDKINIITSHSRRINIKLKNRNYLKGLNKLLYKLSIQKLFYTKYVNNNQKCRFVIKILFIKLKFPIFSQNDRILHRFTK